MNQKKYTFVTVVYEAEYDLLLLQARSMSVFCPVNLVDRIIIVDNSDRPISNRWKVRISAEYGNLANIVSFVRSDALARVPPADGWWSQQVLKLMVSRIVETDRYVVVDAKSHLVFPLDRRFLECPDGRARINVYGFREHPLRQDLERVLDYLAINNPDSYIDRFTPAVPPFVMYTDIVRRLVQDVSERENSTFEAAFIKNRLTEFFLYTGYIIKCGSDLAELYDFHQVFCPIIWGHTADEKGSQEAVAKAREQRTPFFALHRRAILNLRPQAQSAVAEFWSSRGLFVSASAADSFLSAFRRRYHFHVWSKFLRSIPRKLRSRASSLARRLVYSGVGSG
jgi:Family of unknown function (DUF6492)